MIIIKKKGRLFFRSLYISLMVCLCLAIGFFGIAKAYENTLQIGFGEYKKAVEYSDGVLRILDFEFDIF